MKDEAVDAVEAAFALSKAIADGELSVLDLEAVFRMAVAEGHEHIAICLSMASIAVERAKAV